MSGQAPESVRPYTYLAQHYDAMEAWVCGDWHESTRVQMADFIEAVWQKRGAPVHKVLDLCCGTGLLLREMTQRGYTVTGVDRSATMLEQSAQKLVPEARERLVQGELPLIPLEEEFDAVHCTGAALNYLPNDTSLLRSFESVYRVLRPGGTFVFDLYTDALMRRYVERTTPHAVAQELPGGYTFSLRCRRPSAGESFDMTSVQYLRDDTTQTYVRTVEVHHVYPQSQEKVRSLVAQAGFGGIEVFDNYRPQPTGSRTLYETYVMVKPD
ncbi:class I SAM-dependent methyltransferase [Streptomyces sp. MP131-18]|uniref:class I SAM-dependent DNA methyltransferase n=1 Tax=Streptomyces sp. MP131-18 TaxID=1857892 RepID=UPI00097C7DD8|nr:class I SAM-dependent methyltransferase [Streptomyces sp. MP131-18]ONK14865.1 Glycine/sarcosine N-methyltransferase [Streptomyces sp. MP131-18]